MYDLEVTEPPVVAMAELIEMLSLSRKRIATLTNEADFPAPIATLTAGRIWSYDDVKAWAEGNGRAVYPIPAR